MLLGIKVSQSHRGYSANRNRDLRSQPGCRIEIGRGSPYKLVRQTFGTPQHPSPVGVCGPGQPRCSGKLGRTVAEHPICSVHPYICILYLGLKRWLGLPFLSKPGLYGEPTSVFQRTGKTMREQAISEAASTCSLPSGPHPRDPKCEGG